MAIDYKSLLERYVEAVIHDDEVVGERCCGECDASPEEVAYLRGVVAAIMDLRDERDEIDRRENAILLGR